MGSFPSKGKVREGFLLGSFKVSSVALYSLEEEDVDEDDDDPCLLTPERGVDDETDPPSAVLELGSFLGDFLRLSPVEAALEFELSESDEYLRLVSACGPLEETVVALQLVLVVLLVEGVLIVALEVHLVDS